jgi:hypothetical protein
MTNNCLALDTRIAPAFGDDVSSDEVAALVAEVEDAEHAASEAAERAREPALDPALPTNEIAERRRAMEDAAFTLDRLSTALSRLQLRLEQSTWSGLEKGSALSYPTSMKDRSNRTGFVAVPRTMIFLSSWPRMLKRASVGRPSGEWKR